MKSINAIILAGLAAVIIVTAACIDLHNKKTMKNLQTMGNSKGFAIVELFTSEGCSSCPPADELVETIQKDNKNKQIYILAFHVDYWDHQGWKDRFSNPEFTKRQRQYASWLNTGSVYTPQTVVNGTAEYIGSDQGSIVKAISAELEKESNKTLTLNCKIEGNKVNVEYQGAGEEKNSEIVLALIQKSAESRVKAGENSGRNLAHVQIVREMIRFPLDIGGKKSLPMDLPNDFNEKNWELIGFVQNSTDGHITSAGRFDFNSGLAISK